MKERKRMRVQYTQTV